MLIKNSATKIYITRHGETEWNTQRRMQGRLNSALTERGELQADLLGSRLADVPFSAIYASTAQRAIDTASRIRGDRAIELLQHEGFCEMGLGSWEGQVIDELLEAEGVNCYNFFNNPALFTPPQGAESFGDVQARFASALHEVASSYGSEEAILIVSHGMALRILLAYLSNQSLNEVWGDAYKPTALSLLLADAGKYDVVFWNDTSHYQNC